MLPPSEGKAAPRRGKPLDLASLDFPALTPARERVLDTLGELCAGDPDVAAKTLGIGSTQLDLVDLNADGSVLRGAIERYSTDRGSLQRSLPPPGSPGRDARLRDFATSWLDRLGTLDFDKLGRDGRVDYLLFKNHLEHELRQLDLRARERSAAARAS